MFASHVCSARFCSVMKKVRYGDQACNLEINKIKVNAFILCFLKFDTKRLIKVNSPVSSLVNPYTVQRRSRTAATFKMEHFVIIVNGWKLLTIITKCSILDIAAVLDLPPQKFKSSAFTKQKY